MTIQITNNSYFNNVHTPWYKLENGSVKYSAVIGHSYSEIIVYCKYTYAPHRNISSAYQNKVQFLIMVDGEKVRCVMCIRTTQTNEHTH